MATIERFRVGVQLPVDDLLARTALRYRGGSHFTRHYIAAKLRRDPVHRDILAHARAQTLGRVIDLGAGRGQMGVALLLAGLAESVLAIDLDPGKLAEAARAADGLALATRVADFGGPLDLPGADTVLIVDVLYQLPTDTQQRLLAAAMSAAPRLLIRTQDPRRGPRSWFARGLEIVLRRYWPTSGARVNPLAVEQICQFLAENHFTTSANPCWGKTGLANVLLEARSNANT